MLQALYAYKGTHARTLCFGVGDKFIEIGISRDPNWCHVINANGKIGYVPKNYVSAAETSALEILDVIDGCIEVTHLNASVQGGVYSKTEQEVLQKLVELRQKWHQGLPASSHPSKWPAPPPPQLNFKADDCQNNSSIVSSHSNRPLCNSLSIDSSSCSSSSWNQKCNIDANSVGCSSNNVSQNNHVISEMISNLPKNFLKTIVDGIRSETNINYATSHKVVELVLKNLSMTFPVLERLTNAILKESVKTKLCNWQDSPDGRKLVNLLENLRECKDDEQQRSWALFEDEEVIASYLSNILDILRNGDIEVCQHVLSLDDYKAVLTLVQFYQMETRWTLRKLLLKVFGVICEMSVLNVSYLSSCILPVELVRDILENKQNIEKVRYSSLVLSMVLSSRDKLPYTHYSIINKSFISFVLDEIEKHSSRPDSEHLADLFMTVILGLNIQFRDERCQECNAYKASCDNPVCTIFNPILCLLSSKPTKSFMEKLLILFNREEDPLHMFVNHPNQSSSVIILMEDIYSCHTTANLMYTNDEKVVCDIVLRQLTDLSPDDLRFSSYLHLLYGVFENGGWREHRHHCKEIVKCCENLLNDQEKLSPGDAALLKNLGKKMKEFVLR